MTITVNRANVTHATVLPLPTIGAITTHKAWDRSSKRMWGNATVPGTRIPIFRLRELYEAGYSPESIAKDAYRNRITPGQVRRALSIENIPPAADSTA